MAPIPSVDAIVSQLKTAATGIITADVTTIRGYSERQVRMLAQHAKWIAEAEVNGDFANDPQLREWFLNNLDDMTKNFAQSLKGLLAITVEKVWNAEVNVLWTVIEKSTGLALPRPL